MKSTVMIELNEYDLLNPDWTVGQDIEIHNQVDPDDGESTWHSATIVSIDKNVATIESKSRLDLYSDTDDVYISFPIYRKVLDHRFKW